MVIAIDFDGTIATHSYPECGEIKPHAKDVINELYDAGHQIIIWTCRSDDSLDLAKEFLAEHGIRYHRINEQLQSVLDEFGETRKIFADVYIDDRNLGGLPDWKTIRKILGQQFAL